MCEANAGGHAPVFHLKYFQDWLQTATYLYILGHPLDQSGIYTDTTLQHSLWCTMQ